jgi:hypothetical protein
MLLLQFRVDPGLNGLSFERLQTETPVGHRVVDWGPGRQGQSSGKTEAPLIGPRNWRFY